MVARAADWTITPRQADLTRIQDPLSKWSKLHLVERHNTPDTWTITGDPASMKVFETTSGCILDRNSKYITSGKLAGINRGSSGQGEYAVYRFVEDLKRIGGRVVLPTPSQELTGTPATMPDAYDRRTGSIESLIIGYVRSNAGDLAIPGRRVPRLRVPASLNRGGTTQVSGRFDHLGVLITSLAESGNLRVKVVHTEDVGGSWLDLTISESLDLSSNIRFGTAGTMSAGLINDWSWDFSSPTSTRAVVAGGGELTARDLLQVIDYDAELLWDDMIETLVDQRQVDPTSTNKQDELTRGGQENLDEDAGKISISFTPILGPDLQYRRDVRVGDIVGYDLPGLDPGEDKIREARTTVSVENGKTTETVDIIVGTPDAPLTRDQKQQARALRAINVIQRSR